MKFHYFLKLAEVVKDNNIYLKLQGNPYYKGYHFEESINESLLLTMHT